MAHDSSHHITPLRTYLNVYGVLLVLTVVTVLASRFNFGFMNTIIAMLIASVKASFVILWFMHQKYENKGNRVIFGSSLFFLFLLVFFTFTDTFTRWTVKMVPFAERTGAAVKIVPPAGGEHGTGHGEAKPAH